MRMDQLIVSCFAAHFKKSQFCCTCGPCCQSVLQVTSAVTQFMTEFREVGLSECDPSPQMRPHKDQT